MSAPPLRVAYSSRTPAGAATSSCTPAGAATSSRTSAGAGSSSRTPAAAATSSLTPVGAATSSRTPAAAAIPSVPDNYDEMLDSTPKTLKEALRLLHLARTAVVQTYDDDVYWEDQFKAEKKRRVTIEAAQVANAVSGAVSALSPPVARVLNPALLAM